MEFSAVVTGDREAIARFAEWPKQLHDSLYQRIEKLTNELYARVLELVPEKTGALKKEIISKMFDGPERIKGYVSLAKGLDQEDYIKAGALEYGAHTGVKVRPYRRTITEAFGRSISPTDIDVKAYQRVANIEAHLFMRGALAGMESEVVAELTDAINEVAKD